jgi:hypothetical protein
MGRGQADDRLRARPIRLPPGAAAGAFERRSGGSGTRSVTSQAAATKVMGKTDGSMMLLGLRLHRMKALKQR